jgi:hypothetical protein
MKTALCIKFARNNYKKMALTSVMQKKIFLYKLAVDVYSTIKWILILNLRKKHSS